LAPDSGRHVADAEAGDGRHRVGLAHAQRPGLGRVAGVLGLFGLVHDEHHGALLADHHLGELLVLRGDAGATVDDEEDEVGLVEGGADLVAHLLVDHAFGLRHEAAGVDDGEPLAVVFLLLEVTVAGDAFPIRNHGRAAAEDAVEQAGFADVGTAGNDDAGKTHSGSDQDSK
jgi:hypothetical protein